MYIILFNTSPFSTCDSTRMWKNKSNQIALSIQITIGVYCTNTKGKQMQARVFEIETLPNLISDTILITISLKNLNY